MTRVISGVVGGRRIETVPGLQTRPTTDRVREALFSTLDSDLGTWSGRSFLDLYAGSGAVGLEAASRGSDRVLLVEQARAAVAVIRRNVATLGLPGLAVVGSPVERWAARAAPPGSGFDVVFADPPYGLDGRIVAAVLETLLERGWLAPAARVVVERERRARWDWPGGFSAVRERSYGETMLWYGRVALLDTATEPAGPADPVADPVADPGPEAPVDDEEV